MDTDSCESSADVSSTVATNVEIEISAKQEESNRSSSKLRDRSRSPVWTEGSNKEFQSSVSKDEPVDAYCHPLGLLEVNLHEYQDGQTDWKGQPSQPGSTNGAPGEVGDPSITWWGANLLKDIYSSDEEQTEEESAGPEDKDSGEENEADGEILNPSDNHFQWYTMDSFKLKEETFKPKRTGSVKTHSSPYSAFRAYWDDDILQYIVQEANSYAETITSTTFKSAWVPTNTDEILVLFCFWTMLGVIPMPTIKSCFSTNPLLETTIFRRLFKRQRYAGLTKAMHFINICPDAGRMSRISPILTHLNEKFKANFIPSREICIDESLNLWKGRPANFAKFKMFELCDSDTGYLWSFNVSTGKNSSLAGKYSRLQNNTGMVLQLIEPLLHKGYRLYTTKWFNTPALARFLKQNGTDCFGTLRPDREHVPPVIGQYKLKRDEVIARHSGDVCVMAWQDTKKVTTISTCHGIEPADPKTGNKPQVVLDHNKYLGGVDHKDQALDAYLPDRKRCMNMFMKLFRRLLNCSILNARILYQSSTGKHQDHLDFRLRLVDDILSKHLSQCPDFRKFEKTSHSRKSCSRTCGHFPARVPQTPGDAMLHRQSRKKCHWCKSRKSPFKCEQCNVTLCMENCFKSFHLSSSSS